MKLVWRVGSVPTGRYRSFDRREWPSAYWSNAEESPAVRITCADEYTPSRAKAGDHQPLQVYVADFSMPSNKETGCGFTWRKMKKDFATLGAAKAAAESLLATTSTLAPKTQAR
jgi:hypothetical protein